MANSPYDMFDKSIFKHEEKIKTKHFSKEDDKKYSSIFYPIFKYPTLNKAIEQVSKKEVSYRTKDKYIYLIDYQIINTPKGFISIKFHQFIFNQNHEKLVEQIQILNYDVNADKILSLHDVLRKDYMNIINLRILEDHKNYTLSDISDFSIHEEEIRIYFQHEKKKYITLPYQKYYSYIRLKHKKIPSLYQKQQIKKITTNIDPNKPMIAFTFDDGPSKEYTKQIMDIFNKANGKATFFMLGTQVKKYPEVVSTIYQQGFEVASHTLNHKNLAFLNKKETYTEIMKTQDLIYQITGEDPLLLRPPYGSLPNIDVASLNLHIALWNIDTLDWKSKDPNLIQQNILNDVKDGSIILMHDIYKTSVQSIEKIVPILKQQGYQFVTMSDMIQYRYNK